MTKDVKNSEHLNLSNTIFNDSQNYKQFLLKEFTYNFVNLLSIRNPASWHAFNFIELNLPVVIKRDSVYRGGYGYDHFDSQLKKYFKDEHEQIIMLIKKPSASNFKGLKKLMWESGVI
jgi:hypothetical protein